MKVLWSANIIPSEMLERLTDRKEVMGGWIEAMASQLYRQIGDLKLGIACKCDNGEKFHDTVGKTEYFSITYDPSGYEGLKKQCDDIIKRFSPDLVQVEGTEFPHSRAMLFAAKEAGIPVAVSLQGILNGQYNYQCGQLQVDDLMFSRSFMDVYNAWFMHLRKTCWFKKRLYSEREIIENADYILGRTTWDRAHAYSINPRAKYFKVSRILRQPFYETSWDIDKIERHSIYTGSGYTALKGLHYLVMAMPQLLKEYPDTKIYVAGYNPYDGSKRAFIKKGYAFWLKKLIQDNACEDHIIFTGTIPAAQVADRLLKANAYVLSSAIENSPNTLGEAMIVGTPCVASYVGGVPDMVNDGEDALVYRNDDPSLLAWNIKRIFDDDQLALRLSQNAQKHAAVTHSPEENAELLLKAYKEILNG